MKPIGDTLRLLESADTQERVFTHDYMVPLLPLLEHPHSLAESELRQALSRVQTLSEHSATNLLRSVVLCAFASESEYWARLAAGWLEDGFPLDGALCQSAATLSKSISQSTRHRAIRAAKQWERKHHEPGNV